MGGCRLLHRTAGSGRRARPHRPFPVECDRLVTGDRAPVRGHRRTDRRHAGETARAERRRARPHLHLRRRWTGGRHDRGGCMNDWYTSFANSKPGGAVIKRAGLPRPQVLRRYQPDRLLLHGPAMIVTAGESPRMADAVTNVLADARIQVIDPDSEDRPAALIVDATSVSDAEGLAQLHRVTSGRFKRLRSNGRVLVLGSDPTTAASPAEAAARRALDGFMRSVGKECRSGSTANLITVAHGAEAATASTLRFFLSGRSAYVSGQPITVSDGPADPPADWRRPLDGQVAVVTGAARGIGASIAEVLGRDGAEVVCLDIPSQGAALAEVANRVGGTALQLDLTGSDAPTRLLGHLAERHGRVDVIVHNAGITQDKMLVNMSETRWQSVIDVNLSAQLAINDALLSGRMLAPEGVRIVGLASTSGIAGNRGQTNYAASKAGILGMVAALGAKLGAGTTANAVAPGFIETEMTARMPALTRQVARRLNSLQQGGLPIDVAETIAFLAGPQSGGITGGTLRVCGQNMVGA